MATKPKKYYSDNATTKTKNNIPVFIDRTVHADAKLFCDERDLKFHPTLSRWIAERLAQEKAKTAN